MDALVTTDVFLFEGFRLDRCGGGLFRRDEAGVFVPTPIGSRALDVLGVLVSRPGDLVSRDEIINAVWPGTIVENSNLPVQVAALRRILDEGRPNGSCIQTLPGRGYRFVAPVTRSATTDFRDGARPRLSIVVLPFSNVGNDPQQQYFADAITEDVTTDLSRIPDMIVISQNTAFTYRNKLVDTKQIGRELVYGMYWKGASVVPAIKFGSTPS
jgi:DNA-binding winged helix-turn-helix (wHTH) protein